MEVRQTGKEAKTRYVVEQVIIVRRGECPSLWGTVGPQSSPAQVARKLAIYPPSPDLSLIEGCFQEHLPLGTCLPCP